MNTVAMRGAVTQRRLEPPRSATGVGLWIFIGVATVLFSLFIAAYAMRMAGADWSSIAMPWQLWLSTLLLAGGSLALHRAGRASREVRWRHAHALLLAGGVCTLAFLAVQLWAWQALLAIHVMPAGNPAASFFFLLTAMHGLHVLGGLLAWGVTTQAAWHPDDSGRAAELVALCARYWHFLLAVWLVLFATLGGLTPEVVAFICGGAAP